MWISKKCRLKSQNLKKKTYLLNNLYSFFVNLQRHFANWAFDRPKKESAFHLTPLCKLDSRKAI